MEDDKYYVATLEVAFCTKEEANKYVRQLLDAWCDMPMNEDKWCITGVHERKIVGG